MPAPIDRTGVVVGKLTVIERVPPTTGTKSAHWLCRCDGGDQVIILLPPRWIVAKRKGNIAIALVPGSVVQKSAPVTMYPS